MKTTTFLFGALTLLMSGLIGNTEPTGKIGYVMPSGEIQIYYFDGGTHKMVSYSALDNFTGQISHAHLRFSPNGERIAVKISSNKRKDPSGIGVIDLANPLLDVNGDPVFDANGDPVFDPIMRLVSEEGAWPTWSPDGKWLAFGGWNQGGAVIRVPEDLENGPFYTAQEVTSDASTIAWSPCVLKDLASGDFFTHLVFSSSKNTRPRDSELWMLELSVELDETQSYVDAITAVLPETSLFSSVFKGSDGNVEWSPSDWILFNHGEGKQGDGTDIYRVNPFTYDTQGMVMVSSVDPADAINVIDLSGNDWQPRWSSDDPVSGMPAYFALRTTTSPMQVLIVESSVAQDGNPLGSVPTCPAGQSVNFPAWGKVFPGEDTGEVCPE